jgi:hypothetical protein
MSWWRGGGGVCILTNITFTGWARKRLQTLRPGDITITSSTDVSSHLLYAMVTQENLPFTFSLSSGWSVRVNRNELTTFGAEVTFFFFFVHKHYFEPRAEVYSCHLLLFLHLPTSLFPSETTCTSFHDAVFLISLCMYCPIQRLSRNIQPCSYTCPSKKFHAYSRFSLAFKP